MRLGHEVGMWTLMALTPSVLYAVHHIWDARASGLATTERLA